MGGRFVKRLICFKYIIIFNTNFVGKMPNNIKRRLDRWRQRTTTTLTNQKKNVFKIFKKIIIIKTTTTTPRVKATSRRIKKRG